MRAVSINGLNIKEVPKEFINEELVNLAIQNTPFAKLTVPIEYIKDDNLDSIFDSIDLNYFQKLNLYTNLHKRESYFSVEQLLIIKGPSVNKNLEKISTLVRSNREFLLRYVKYRGIHNFIIELETLIDDYEVLSYINIEEYINIEVLDKISLMDYLIKTTNKNQIKKLITYTKDMSIDMMYNLVLLDRSYIIYFGEKYWDGKILTKYEQYKIKNSKNYMYLCLYLRSKSIDLTFISHYVLSFLTNNYKYLL